MSSPLNDKTVRAITAPQSPGPAPLAQANFIKDYQAGFAAGSAEERERIRLVLLRHGLQEAAVLASMSHHASEPFVKLIEDTATSASPDNTGDLIDGIVALHRQWSPHR